MLSRKEFIRYSRQIMLPSIGEAGQEKLLGAHVAIVGLGGLGCPVLQYLAGAGIGNFTLIDDDQVALENLHRQLLYRESDIGTLKAEVAALRAREINPAAVVHTHIERLHGSKLDAVIAEADLVLDCTDSLDSRLEINRAAVAGRKAHVVGTGIRAEGQLVSFDHSLPNSPCYACLMSEQDADGLTCAESGVVGPLLGVIGSAMAMSAINYIAMPEEFVLDRWQFFDALKQSWISLDLERRSDCPVCS